MRTEALYLDDILDAADAIATGFSIKQHYEQLAKLRQPPYGDRAVVLKPTGRLIGACGYVPCLNPLCYKWWGCLSMNEI